MPSVYFEKKRDLVPSDEPKTCTKCGELKDADQFYVSAGYKGGRTSRCAECLCEYGRERYRRRRAAA